jgi:DNA-binding transcriptional regulator YhcF (GntR family)
MDIHINRESEVPIHEQVSAQIVFLIGTGRWAPGTDLPSVRALSQRLGVHRNTITQAYDDLILKLLVEKRAGARLRIRGGDRKSVPQSQDLDDVLNSMIREAGRLGFSLQQLHNRLRDRLFAAPADHLLVLSGDEGMRKLFLSELRECFECPVEVCTPDDLVANPDRGIGALVVSPPVHIPTIQPVLARDRAPVSITYSPGDDLIEEIRRLQKPALIAIVSISEYFLGMARGVLAGAVGQRHSIGTYLMTGRRRVTPGAADLLVCDAVTYPVLRPRYKPGIVFQYRLISPASLEHISSLVANPPRPSRVRRSLQAR